MNEITISGNLANNPSVRTLSTQAFAKFRLAHNHRYRDQQSGEWTDGGTTFIDVTCWRSLAENVERSLGKGSAVIVTGRLRGKEREVDVAGSTEKRTFYEIEATAIGPDLSRGATQAVDVKRESVERQEQRAVDGALVAMDPWAPQPA